MVESNPLDAFLNKIVKQTNSLIKAKETAEETRSVLRNELLF